MQLLTEKYIDIRSVPFSCIRDKLSEIKIKILSNWFTPCNKAHPPRCLNYCRFAKDNKLGCTKGEERKYYHPTLCRNSVKRRVCLVVDCKFTHLKGTKKYDPDLRVNQRSQRNRDHIPGQPQVRVTAAPIAQARTILQQTPSVHLSVNRIQNQLQQQKTYPGRIAEANSADNYFLSKLP